MLKTPAWAARSADSPLAPYTIERRECGPHDVLIDIMYAGICHSDIHQVRNEWGGSIYPMVPGHEISGVVSKAGSRVKRWKPGDRVGVGPVIDSCRKCEGCTEGEEQFCAEGMTPVYNGYERDGKTPTYGGCSARITVNEDYVVEIPASIPLDRAAPMMCAGITTFSPLSRHGVRPGEKVAVAGLGGLGHMALKIARAMGAEVSVLSHTPGKREPARRIGAADFIDTNRPDAFSKNRGRFDFIVDTIPVRHDYNAYVELLRRDGTMVLLGVPDPFPLSADSLIMGRRKLAGSLIGGIRETQQMLDFCAVHNVAAEVEVIPVRKINEAYERVIDCDVRFRFVVDAASLSKQP